MEDIRKGHRVSPYVWSYEDYFLHIGSDGVEKWQKSQRSEDVHLQSIISSYSTVVEKRPLLLQILDDYNVFYICRIVESSPDAACAGDTP